jgi:hypothetical protein
MAHRYLFAALLAALFVLSDDAVARPGGGRGGAPGFARFGGPPVVQRAGVRPNLFRAARFLRRPVTRRDVARLAYPWAWPYGGLWYGGYGAYYDGFAPAEFYDPGEAGLAATIAQQLALTRPSCRLITQTREVPSEAGGLRRVTITRCLSGFSDFEAVRNAADADDDASITGSVPAATAGPAENAAHAPDARACRTETRIVPSEAGGDRTVTVRRC